MTTTSPRPGDPATRAAGLKAPGMPAGIDPRGPRFAAAVSAVVLSAALLLVSPVLLAIQTVAFALGAFGGPARQPYGIAYRRFVQPRLGPPDFLEDPAPPRFAQACGLMFGTVGLIGLSFGLTWLAMAAMGLALAASFLNAAFDFCVGCEIYLLGRRLRRA